MNVPICAGVTITNNVWLEHWTKPLVGMMLKKAG
jgi:hypothetical protein